MHITDTFVRVAEDCPIEIGMAPVSTRTLPPVHVIQYQLLSTEPYKYNLEELIYEVHVRHKQIPQEEQVTRKEEIWAELFSKNHPCMRASMLPKRFGWGVHYNAEGKIAIYAKESPEYDQFIMGEGEMLKLVYAMRSKRRLRGGVDVV